MHSQKILLTGITGQVGRVLQPLLASADCVSLSREQLDLSNADMVRQVIREIKPNLIINPAAYTAVDKAESEPELAYAINATAPGIMAEEAAKLGCALIHFSTDYVYDGAKTSPYTEQDQANPVNVYGKSKLAGEDAIRTVGVPHLILRTSWVYSAYGRSFLSKIINLAKEQDKLGIVADQFSAPTSNLSIAKALKQLLNTWEPAKGNQTGIYHFTNTGSTSWYGFACEIVKQYGAIEKLKVSVEDIKALTTADYSTVAARPANSRLNTDKLTRDFNLTLPSWQDGLKEVMQEM